MSSLTNHTVLNGLESNLKDSIEFVGGSVPEGTCIWEFPEIIKKELTGNSVQTGHIIAGNGIKVERTPEGYVVSADVDLTASAEDITIDHIDAPSWAKGLDENAWEEGTPLQKVLEDLFDNVLPNVPSVLKGDVIVTDDSGKDPFAPELTEYIDALDANTTYLRLFLASQETPIYISLKDIGGNVNLSNYYTKSDVDAKIKEAVSAIEIPEIDLSNHYTKNETNTIIEGIEQIVVEQTDKITQVTEQINKIDQTIIQEVQNNAITEVEADELFDSIFKN